MPVIESVRKALRQNEKRRKINASKKLALKKTIKQYHKLLAEDTKKAEAFLSTVYKGLDKAAKTKLIKPNKASRTKSRLAAKLKK
ncbi:MAG: 30S ribosomal protein S20 [Candidatus Harrisonbacteria bacterium CG10_big_fil_rev_8_21_14_0_10_49_15]|uniref:Small ribosomal subunit protein bS20 n=1 Tax=Candidatus Harrisonbacteria bacterium CG10_big_fil_rev_8_21_14_0_10_49_15 TaxID=1974587 RepID=A0A2H0UKB1_9BACT|nr:MAG: 30S ribosomal protein S20 [Candidatus Harrisonbacteria bacterium CG10_big_fil_rev_8_21_14_0_10_49_15]